MIGGIILMKTKENKYMLISFSVENYKGFKDKITFDIGSPSNYSFNPAIIENGCITKGIVYGID